MTFRDQSLKVLNTALNTFKEKNPVTYLPASGGTYEIRGVFDETWEEVDPDTSEVVISSTRPNLGISIAELGFDPLEDDKLEVNDQLYKVIDVHEDGQEGATLFLHKVKDV